MSFVGDLSNDFASVLKYGTQVRFRYFTASYGGAGSGYDDDITLAASGTDVYVSGVVFPVTDSAGHPESAVDRVLLEQGRVLMSDKRLYVAGSVSTSGLFRVGIGSPPTQEFKMLPDGVISYDVQGSSVYRKLYIRALTTGSLIGELDKNASKKTFYC